MSPAPNYSHVLSWCGQASAIIIAMNNAVRPGPRALFGCYGAVRVSVCVPSGCQPAHKMATLDADPGQTGCCSLGIQNAPWLSYNDLLQILTDTASY